MIRIIFEYHRVPRQHVYDVSLLVIQQAASQQLVLEMQSIDLQDAAVSLHHAVKLIASTKSEFLVRCVQGNTGTNLTRTQIETIMESEDSAKKFFAPLIIERKPNANP